MHTDFDLRRATTLGEGRRDGRSRDENHRSQPQAHPLSNSPEAAGQDQGFSECIEARETAETNTMFLPMAGVPWKPARSDGSGRIRSPMSRLPHLIDRGTKIHLDPCGHKRFPHP